MKIVKTAKILSVVSMIALTTGPAASETVLRLASVVPSTSPWGVWLQQVSDKVAADTGGDLTIELVLDAQAGDEDTILRQTVRGRYDLALLSNNPMTTISQAMAVTSAPYNFASADEGSCVVHEHLSATLTPVMEEAGLTPLSWVEAGHYVMFSREKITLPGDLADKKVRIANNIADVNYGAALGTTAVPMGASDVLPALQTGAVDAAWFPAVYGIAVGTHQAAPNVLVTNHSRLIGTVAMSVQSTKGLSQEQLEALQAFDTMAPTLTKMILGAEGALLGKIESAGVPVHRLTDEEEAAWRASAEGVRAAIVDAAGGPASDIAAAIDAAKAACNG